MWTVVDEWEPLKDGRYFLTLNKAIPSTYFNKYRIDGKEYDVIPVHFHGKVTFDVIGIKAQSGGGFIGMEVEFVGERESKPDKIVYDPDAPPACEKEMEELMKLCGEW